jgi:hypothetical protein
VTADLQNVNPKPFFPHLQTSRTMPVPLYFLSQKVIGRLPASASQLFEEHGRPAFPSIVIGPPDSADVDGDPNESSRASWFMRPDH